MSTVYCIRYKAYGLAVGIISLILSVSAAYHATVCLINLQNNNIFVRFFVREFKVFEPLLKLIVAELVISTAASLLLILGIVNHCRLLLFPWLINGAAIQCFLLSSLLFKYLFFGNTSIEEILKHLGAFVIFFMVHFGICSVYKHLKKSNYSQSRGISMQVRF